MKHPIFKSELRNRTKHMLAEHLKYKANTMREIAHITGLSENWIGMFHANKINNPDVGRVETLYNFLAEKQLFDA